MNIKQILKDNTNLKVAENHFIKPPNPPYIVFGCEDSIRGTSKDNLVLFREISIGLYLTLPDKNLKNMVRNVIINNILNISNNDDEIELEENIEYIESEQIYLITFDFNLIEKGGN